MGWVVEAPARGSWRIKYRFIPRKVTTASDASGNVMATFTERKRELTTGGRTLRFDGGAQIPRRRWREPLVLVEGDRELARFECRTFSGATKNQVEVTIVEERLARDEPLLVLFAAFNAGMLAATLNAHGAVTPFG
jgi:hypothetical protein